MKTFSEMGEWEEMEKLSRSKKSPIGYEVTYFILFFKYKECELAFCFWISWQKLSRQW